MNFKEILEMYNVQIEGLRSIGETDLEINSTSIEPYKANQKAILTDFKDYLSKRKKSARNSSNFLYGAL